MGKAEAHRAVGGVPPAFAYRCRPSGGRTVVHVEGEIDAYTSPRLRGVVQDLIDRGVVDLVVDLSGTTFIDSSGLGVLIGLARRARDADGTLVVANPAAGVRKVFEITAFERVVAVEVAPA